VLGVYSPADGEQYAAAVRREMPGEDVRVFASAQDVAQAAHGLEALLLNWHVSFRFPAGLDTLRLVQAVSAGVDGIEAKQIPPHVPVARAVDVFSAFMVEYLLAHLLARSQAVHALQDAQRRHAWGPHETFSWSGRSLGVAGLGSVGGHLARAATAIGMQVHGYSRTGAAAAGLPLRSHTVAAPGALREFAAGLDVLVLALPLTPGTRRVVDRAVLRALGPRGILVNVGRGALVDAEALLEALRAGELGGAILDVFDAEPLPPDSPWWDAPNVTVTPHLSGPDQHDGVARLFAENVRRVRAGRRPRGEVDRGRGY